MKEAFDCFSDTSPCGSPSSCLRAYSYSNSGTS